MNELHATDYPPSTTLTPKNSSEFRNFKSFTSTPNVKSESDKLKKGPCTYCEKNGHPGRAHFESECYTKKFDEETRRKRNNLKNSVENKFTNLVELGEVMDEFERKNE